MTVLANKATVLAEKATNGGLDVFYPIVPDITWLRRIVPLGVRTIQLRLKDASHDEILRQIRESLEVCAENDCQLIVNDYWREALLAGADYVHLGQEDLASADIPTMKARKMRVGISTHDAAELDAALAVNPDYVALGPVWETKLKAMKWAPQGVDKVRSWRARLGNIPLVAIGGITLDRAPSVIDAGAASVAVITDFITHKDPEQRVTAWLAWAKQVHAAQS
jgi:thiamine-phosphate pyrophosphorylase